MSNEENFKEILLILFFLDIKKAYDSVPIFNIFFDQII